MNEVPFINRESELSLIEDLIENAIAGKSSAILIKGDVGIGKTRLVEEVVKIAKTKNFQVGIGHGMRGVKIPFVTLSECFSEIGIEHMLSTQKPPRVDCIYLTTNNGLLVAKVERENFEIKPEIFTAMLSLVNKFVQDSMRLIHPNSKGWLGRLEYEGWWIVIERLGELNLVAILSGRESELLIEDMRTALFNIQKKYGKILKHWNGDYEEVRGIEEEFRHIITSGKYDGIEYGKEDLATQRVNLFENVLHGISRVSAERPIMLVIENIQWADESTISILSYLIQNLREAHLFLLFTARSHELEESFAGEVLGELVNAGKIQEIELGELSREDAIKILESIASGIRNSQEVLEVILGEAGGNPLFLIEITKDMLATKEIVFEDGVWRIAKGKEHRVPKKIEEIFKKKLGGLSTELRELLECASAIGETFPPQILESVFGIDRFELLRKLRTLENTGLLRFLANECAFGHALAREVIYQSIPQPVRALYHEKIAEAMEKIYKDKAEMCSRIGYHYYKAGNAGKSLPYLIKGIRNAASKFANEEALQLIAYALELSEKEGMEDVTVSLLEHKADIYQITGKYKEALEVYKKLLEHGKAKERIYRKMGECAHALGNYEEALEYVRKGLEGIEKVNLEYGRLKLLEGIVHYRKGEIEDAQHIFLELLSVFEEYGAEERERALLLNNLGNVYFEKRELKKALDYYRLSLGIREKINEHLAISGSYNNLGIVYRYMHEYSTALAYFQKSLKQAEKCGYLWGMVFPLDNMAELYFAVGELERAVECYKKEIQVLKKIENIQALINTFGKLAKAYAKHERFDEAMECLVESGAYVLKTNNPILLAQHFLAHVSVYREQEKYERGLEFAERALLELKKVSKEGQAKILILNALSDKADLLCSLAKYAEAEKVCNTIFNFPSMDVLRGASFSYISFARILAQKGRLEEARKEFKKGIEALELYGGEYRVASAYMAWGKAELNAGNRENAIVLLDKALKLFTMMRIERRIREAREEIKKCNLTSLSEASSKAL